MINLVLPQESKSDAQRLMNLCGVADDHLRKLESLLNITINRRGEYFTINAQQLEHHETVEALAINVLESLFIKAEQTLTTADLYATFYESRMRQESSLKPVLAVNVKTTRKVKATTKAKNLPANAMSEAPMLDSIHAGRRVIHPRTPHQRAYLQGMESFDMVFGVGPAGTGKTYLAVASAVHALELGHVQRIILTRPALEAGEKLGFLPGSLADKVDPYLRPVYDALYDMLGLEKFQRYQERGIIEIAPLAFMRGRTLNEAFIILDEAQNTTPEQMKMFLTRMGYGGKMVINGDLTQTDLPLGRESGLREACKRLQNIEGVQFIFFDRNDVVRHPLVAKIIDAYENH